MRRPCLTMIVFAVAMAVAAGPSRSQDVRVPELSPDARRGGVLFTSKCAACHGYYGQGTKKGPPMLHQYYRPGHHSDQAFRSAIRNGSPAHHWSFGDMKPVEGVADGEIPLIVRYVRELQRANGIF